MVKTIYSLYPKTPSQKNVIFVTPWPADEYIAKPRQACQPENLDYPSA